VAVDFRTRGSQCAPSFGLDTHAAREIESLKNYAIGGTLSTSGAAFALFETQALSRCPYSTNSPRSRERFISRKYIAQQ